MYHETIKAHAAIPKVVRKDPCRRRVAVRTASGKCFVNKDTNSNQKAGYRGFKSQNPLRDFIMCLVEMAIGQILTAEYRYVWLSGQRSVLGREVERFKSSYRWRVSSDCQRIKRYRQQKKIRCQIICSVIWAMRGKSPRRRKLYLECSSELHFVSYITTEKILTAKT